MDSIYREYSGTVKAFLIRISGNAELAEELTQETFYQAIKSINRFDGRSSLSTWLCSIAKHLYLDAVRKQENAPNVFEDRLAEEDFTERIHRQDQIMIAHRMLHLLDEPYREVFTLKTFCDLTHAQIADLFGKSESWSRVTYYRARQQLQDAMKENVNEEK
ncbi:MAG: sigma-70 family RNA polymerase sigma factor [Clostridia bacterium]|nr:sigma-70 family RNA polymerase sigma factor [Clostridia bacterium]